MNVVHCKHDPYDIYIGRGRDPRNGRPGEWGNPFTHRASRVAGTTVVPSRQEAVERYRRWLWEQIDSGAIGLEALAVLGCWCAPEPCHGEVLVTAAAWAAAQLADGVRGAGP